MFGAVFFSPLAGLVNVVVASGSRTWRSDSHARCSTRAARAGWGIGVEVYVPRTAMPIVPEFHPPVCAPVTPQPRRSSPVVVSVRQVPFGPE
jgi:hypothetical protein